MCATGPNRAGRAVWGQALGRFIGDNKVVSGKFISSTWNNMKNVNVMARMSVIDFLCEYVSHTIKRVHP